MTATRARIILLTLMSIFLFTGIFYSFYGRIFLDAGFYLNASREVYQGHMPYRDFFFVQGPVYPYVYGLPLLLTGTKVLYARWLSLLFGCATVLLATWTTHRIGKGYAWVITLAALTTVPYHAYFFTSVKLYSLAGFLLTAAFAAFASHLKTPVRHSLGMTLVILAAATRLTLVPAIPVALLYVILDARKQKNGSLRAPLLTTLIVSAALSLPFLLSDFQAVFYNLIGIHTSASSGPYLFGITKQLIVLAKLTLFYPVVTVSAIYICFRILRTRTLPATSLLEKTMLLTICLVTGAHLAANWFSMGYQSPLMPLTAVVVASLTHGSTSAQIVKRPILAMLLLWIMAAWFISWHKPIWRSDITAMRSLAFIGRVIEVHTSDSATIAGCNGVIALQANREHALEFGGAPFTFTPGWTKDQCKRFGGMNSEMIIEALETRQIDALVLERDSFAVGFPGFYPVDQAEQDRIFAVIDNNYTVKARFRDLGTGDKDLMLYLPESN